MAERELAIRYQTPARRVGFVCSLVFVPIWALLAPMVFGLLLAYLIVNPTCGTAFLMSATCAALFGIIAAGLLAMAFAEDSRILVSADGMTFPAAMCARLKWRRHRNWAEMRRLDVICDDAGQARILLLGFSDGALLPLTISGLAKAELEQFLVATEAWAGGAERSTAFADYQAALQNQSVGLEGLSYTRMWEEEMSRRFTATTFIPLEPGRKLQTNKYQVVRQIAFGGFSAVYLAQKSGLDMVVLKEAVLPPDTDPQSRAAAEQHLRREAAILSKVEHPGIVHVLDFFVEDGKYYLVMEHISGQDLRQFIKQHGPQPEAKVVEWAIQVATVLEYLHSQEPPIIHRDASPDNLVVSNDGAVRLIDFGASTEFVSNATGTVIGKQAYTAPEQLRGKSCTQSNLYAFGATLFFCLTGKDPVALSVSHPRETAPGVSPALDALVACCTAFDTADRMASAAQVRQTLAGMDISAHVV